MDDDVPIVFCKPKLKTLNFATNITSIFKNFEEDEKKNINLNKPLCFTSTSIKKNEIIVETNENKPSNKRPRTDSLKEIINLENNSKNESNKKICVQKEPENNSENPTFNKTKKPQFNDNNFRRLNMKTFRSKGKGGFNKKGSKYKKFLWLKNKNKNKANAKYGVGVKHDDDEDTFNYNLMQDDTPINQDDKPTEEVVDEMSNEAIFARLAKKQNDSNKNAKSKAKETKTNEKNQENNQEESSDVEEKPKKKTKKSTSTNKKEKKTKSNETKSSNENDKENEESNKSLRKSSKNKKQAKLKKIQNESNPEDEESNFNQESNHVEEEEEDQFIINNNFNQLDTPKPLFELDENGNVPDKLPNYAYKILEKDFGHKKFKKNQEETIIRIACGLSSLAILSTGYGKSLIYQFAALLYARKHPGSIVLVVSPLISLMQDQLHNLTKSIKAASCDSQMTDKEFQELVQDINNGKINILYMSPEAIINKKIKSIPRLAFVCIDEVHCLSQWSHNFRPSYLQLCQVLFNFYNAKCILGLTATATHSTIEEIRSFFDIDKRNIIKDCDLPENLIISISKDNNKEAALVELLKSKQFKPYFNHVIIYCSRREQTERLAQLLRLSLSTYKKKFDLEQISKQRKNKQEKTKSAKNSVDDDLNRDDNIAEAYHAGLTTSQRKRIQNQFIKGKLKIIVATLAFGMGINMPNIRAVIHYNMPKSIENYVQEIGRAGRDGQNSLCYLFLETQREDINEIKKYIHMNGYDQLVVKKLILKIFDCCEKDVCKNQSVDEYRHHVALTIPDMVDLLDVKEETILTLLCYLESAKYVKILSNCFKTCTIKSYKGIEYLNQLAKTNEFVALILKQNKNPITSYTDGSMLELKIDIIELCEITNGEYDVIKQKLKRIEWELDDKGAYKSKSGISVQYHNPSFYIKRKCIRNDIELDEINDLLWNRVDTQMKFCYSNFKCLYKMLSQHSYNNINQFIDSFDLFNNDNNNLNDNLNANNDNNKNNDELPEQNECSNLDDNNESNKKSQQFVEDKLQENMCTTLSSTNNSDQVTFKSRLLKQKLNKYFNNEFDMDEYIKDYDFDCEKNLTSITKDQEMKRLVADIRKFICTYQSDIKLNGLIIARIFHGIGTPRFPNEIWARNRLFWRCHLDFDFEKIIKIATEQLLNF